ncbi:hypothetical protein QJS04_geneDACA004142 [Acorus gramineus]|uniref:Uncharacterized protein n=1 Tax=Acorus gramineus TaxID=55184 RepID=A0AAV9BG61_ACOGR|nr:hypothetical protein QJS04_geneDACA004142 [Acorus gramineus]
MIEGFLRSSPVKMKRRDLDEVNDEFSEFSLSSPARKIRRLDLELPPIMEEEEPPSTPPPPFMDDESPSPSPPLNDERSIVLYRPVDSPLYKVNPELIAGFKNQYFRVRDHQSNMASARDEEEEEEAEATRESMAIVPWVPSQTPLIQDSEEVGVVEGAASEAMETEAETASMEIEEGGVIGGLQQQQWQQQQQQHCLVPELPPNTFATTPVMWSW